MIYTRVNIFTTLNTIVMQVTNFTVVAVGRDTDFTVIAMGRNIDFTAIAADKCNNDKIRSKIKLCQHGLIRILMLSTKGSDLIYM
jgi:hypothetical protein